MSETESHRKKADFFGCGGILKVICYLINPKIDILFSNSICDSIQTKLIVLILIFTYIKRGMMGMSSLVVRESLKPLVDRIYSSSSFSMNRFVSGLSLARNIQTKHQTRVMPAVI